MKRAIGVIGIPLIECVDRELRKYRIRWDIQPYDDGENDNTISFMEREICKKPTLNEVKKIVLEGYNNIINEKILSGFIWRGNSIWLSSENQFNYKSAYDIAVQTNGANLPIKFKFGTPEKPEYYIFETTNDLFDFFISAMTFINKTLQEGWETKDTIDWSEYEKYLFMR